MQARYGSYRHDDNEVIPSLREVIERGAYGQPQKLVRELEIVGRKIGGSASIATQMAALRKAYSVDNKDFIFTDDNGVVMEYLSLRANDSWNGVQVLVPPHTPSLQGADAATKVQYTIRLRWEQLLAPLSELYDLTQSVQISGGGPRIVRKEQAKGRPVAQTVVRERLWIARQSGSCSSFSPSAQIPPPKWPSFRIDNNQPVRTEIPDQASSAPKYRYDWSYDFESESGF